MARDSELLFCITRSVYIVAALPLLIPCCFGFAIRNFLAAYLIRFKMRIANPEEQSSLFLN